MFTNESDAFLLSNGYDAVIRKSEKTTSEILNSTYHGTERREDVTMGWKKPGMSAKTTRKRGRPTVKVKKQKHTQKGTQGRKR